MKKKILIIGPFEDYGGREIDTAFIASSLIQEFDVSICSTGNISKKSQIFTSLSKVKVTSLKKKLYEKEYLLRPATVLSYLKNKKVEPVYFYVNNRFNSYLSFNQKEVKQLRSLIKIFDVIFLRAHLFTLRTKKIIELASEYKVKVIFRTTGEIERKKSWPQYFTKVDLFIHHSDYNAHNLHSSLPAKYWVIDQSALQEEKLLSLNFLKNPIKNFAVVGRLSPEKNILNLVSFFKMCSSPGDNLFIVGDGEERSIIEQEVAGWKNIYMLGQLSSSDTAELFRRIDCLVISSLSEGGPLVGIEAMAAARIIFSTRVGAMSTRLKDTRNNFWFEAKNYNSFKTGFLKLKNLELELIERISVSNRNIYLKHHSKMVVSEKYSNAVQEVLKC